MSEHCAKDERIKLIGFSRNFGHQAAITAGLNRATGDKVVIMDDDLEDPPEVLPKLFEKLDEGFDVVYGVRKKRKRSIFYRIMYKAFYRFLSSMVDINIPNDAGDFCLMRRKVVLTLNAMPERNRYLRGLRAWSGFKQTGYEYDREERFANESGYNFSKYIALAFDAIFSFSYKPLKFLALFGVAMSTLSFVFALILIFYKLSGRISGVPGWTSLFVLILFISGIQFISIGVIGEYVARIYDEVKQRPMYVISRSVCNHPL